MWRYQNINLDIKRKLLLLFYYRSHIIFIRVLNRSI